MVDPDGEWAWAVAFAAYDGYMAYRSGRAKGYRGWRMAGHIAYNVAFGRIGKGFRVAKYAYKYSRSRRAAIIIQKARRAMSRKGFLAKSKNGYVNPRTGRSYYLDRGGYYKSGYEGPHLDVYKLRKFRKSGAKKRKFFF